MRKSSCFPALLANLRSNIDKPETTFTLLKTLARCLIEPALSPAVPRLCLIVFRCSQPVLIRQAMSFLSPALEAERNDCNGYWLLLAAVFVYFGMTVSPYMYLAIFSRVATNASRSPLLCTSTA